MLVAAQLAVPMDLSDIGRYVVDDSWVMEQKLDGHRILVVGGTMDILTRNGSPYTKPVPGSVRNLSLPPGLILDGELVGAEYWAFDLISADGSIDSKPLTIRRSMLELLSQSLSLKIVPQAATTQDKERLLVAAAGGGYEGVVLKRKDGRYQRQARSPQWLKAKFTTTAEAVILSVRDDGTESAELGMVDIDGHLISVGRASLIGKPSVLPGDIVEVKYLYCADPGRPRLYQPTILHLRLDKALNECTTSQLRFTNKSVLDLGEIRCQTESATTQ